MTNEEFQNLVIEKFTNLEGKIGNIEGKVSSLEGKVSSLDAKVSSLDAKVSSLEEKTSNIQTQVNENTQILKALEHFAQINKAEHDQMSNDITHIKGDVTALEGTCQLLR